MNNESGKHNDNAVDSVGGCEPVVVSQDTIDFYKWAKKHPGITDSPFSQENWVAIWKACQEETSEKCLEDLSVDDLPERFREWHRGYFSMFELYATVCPGWATDGTVRHMVRNIISRLKEEGKSDDRLKETEEIIAHFLAFLGPQFESLRDELLKKADDFLKQENK